MKKLKFLFAKFIQTMHNKTAILFDQYFEEKRQKYYANSKYTLVYLSVHPCQAYLSCASVDTA